MEGDNKESTTGKRVLPEQAPSKRPEKTSEGKDALPGETRAEQARLKAQIDTEIAAKTNRRKLLKDESSRRRTPETWLGNGPSGIDAMMESMAKGVISDEVDQKLAKYQSEFDANGIGNTEDYGKIKQVVKDIIYDHFIKNGLDRDITDTYAETRLETKIIRLFGELKKIYESKTYPFGKPADCLQMFSEFTSLNFFTDGKINAQGLKTTFLLNQSDYDFFISSFKQYLNISAELDKLNVSKSALEKTDEAPSGESTALPKPPTGDIPSPSSPEPSSPAPSAAKPSESAGSAGPAPEHTAAAPGSDLLKGKVIVKIRPSAAENREAFRKAIYEHLSPGTSARERARAADNLVKDAEKLGARDGDTVEIDPGGAWHKS